MCAQLNSQVGSAHSPLRSAFAHMRKDASHSLMGADRTQAHHGPAAPAIAARACPRGARTPDPVPLPPPPRAPPACQRAGSVHDSSSLAPERKLTAIVGPHGEGHLSTVGLMKRSWSIAPVSRKRHWIILAPRARPLRGSSLWARLSVDSSLIPRPQFASLDMKTKPRWPIDSLEAI